MSTAQVTFDIRPRDEPDVARARPAGAIHDVLAIAGRSLRAVPRDLEAILPPVFIAFFFFIVNIATLKKLTGNHPGFSYTAFEMATAVLLGQSALALTCDRDRLPDRHGVLTPASAMGDVLLKRLAAAGITVDTVRLG